LILKKAAKQLANSSLSAIFQAPEKWGNGWGISPYLSSRSPNHLKNKQIIYGMQIAQDDLSRIAPNEHLQRGP
jgi:hypothetical protein